MTNNIYYLDKVSKLGLLEKTNIGKTNFYVNNQLIKVLMNV